MHILVLRYEVWHDNACAAWLLMKQWGQAAGTNTRYDTGMDHDGPNPIILAYL